MASSRPTIVYGVMLACTAVGLWAILAIGHDLKPPPNLAGQWRLIPETRGSAALGSTMQIEQSGRFLQVSFENTPRESFRISNSQTPGHVELSGDWGLLRFDGLDAPGPTRLIVAGPHETHAGAWIIHRVDQSAAGAASSSRGGH